MGSEHWGRRPRDCMDHLPFPDAGFDVAVGFNAFPFADDPETALAQAARVVRPRGRSCG
jgi:ubiquinone/menaquinone biosynthesis C-methylase UbiE